MTKRIFRAIFAVAMAMLPVAVLFTMCAVHGYFSRMQMSQLHTQTVLTAQAIAHEGADYFQGLQAPPDCRITWIAADGTVLYDSHSELPLENHLQRKEVLQALEQGYGESSRYSETLMDRFLYAARQLPDGTVLRLSATQSSLLNLLLGMSGNILLLLLAAAVLCYFLSRRLARRIVMPLNELELDLPLDKQEYEEIQPLLRRLDSQQRQLTAQSLQLKQKQREFNTVTRSLSEGLVLLNNAGVILSINPAAASLLDVTPHCLGANFSVANQNSAIAALIQQAMSGTKCEQTVALASGLYLASANPVRTEGGLSGVALLLFDVTQKQQAELMRREFTANVSHELKTPLHAISGYAELMKSGIVSPEDMPRFSGKIYTEAQRLIRLVEDILRLSRLDEGEADMPRVNIDLKEAAQAALQELTAPAELAGIQLHLTGEPVQIQAVAQLVSAILFNLTDNAVKYNKPGGSVTISIGQTEHHAVLSVSDTGIGIPEGDRQRVFERFYRVDKSHSKEVGGTGLGLSIVKHAALILGAEIQLDSTVGEGTTVTVHFPKE